MDVSIATIKALRRYLGARGAQWDAGRGTYLGGQTGVNVKSLVLLRQGIIVRSRGLRVHRINGEAPRKQGLFGGLKLLPVYLKTATDE